MCQVVALGGVVAYGNANSPCTHLVVGRRGAAGRPKRTLKVLHAVLGGAWVVDPKWVLRSLDHGGFLAEEPYEMAAEFPAARRARELRAARRRARRRRMRRRPRAAAGSLHLRRPECDGESATHCARRAAGAKVAATSGRMPPAGRRVAARAAAAPRPSSRRRGCTRAWRRSAHAPWRFPAAQ